MNIRVLLSIILMSTVMQTYSITYLFSHGLAATKAQADAYKKTNDAQSHIIDDTAHTLQAFDYPDAQDGITYPDKNDGFNLKKHIKTISFRVNRYNTSFAQGNEIRVLDQQHADIEDDIIGVGVSRGASAFITWLGTHKDHDKVKNIKALVLESPFDSIDSIIKNALGDYLYQYQTVRSIAHNALRFIFSQYKKRATSPHDAAENVPKDLPILIVCSEQDSRVPASSSEKLYQQLKDTDHANVHLVKLQQGVHGKLIQGPEGHTYRDAVHAFYKKYDLPHNPEYAEDGAAFIA